MPISPSEAKTLKLISTAISTHETLHPPSPGTWSILRQPRAMNLITPFPPVDEFRSVEANIEALRIITPFLEEWTRETWPSKVEMESFTPIWPTLACLDLIRWEFIKLMRHASPSRIAEAEPHCDKMLQQALICRQVENMVKGLDYRLEQKDPQAMLYAGVSLYWSGKDLPRAEGLLKLGLKHTGIIPQRNPIWAYAVLVRVLQDLGKAAEALETEDRLVKYLKSRPTLFSPSVRRYILLGPGETSTRVVERLGIGSEPLLDQKEDRIKGSVSAINRHADHCRKCNDPGLVRKLSKCSRCFKILYCSKECQKADWKAHKPHCLALSQQVQKMEEGSLVSKTRNTLSVFDQFSEFGDALRKTVTDTAPSAFSMDGTVDGKNPRINTHILVIDCLWVPTGKTALDRFDVAAYKLCTDAEVDECVQIGASKEFAEAIKSFPKTLTEYYHLRVLMRGFEKPLGKGDFFTSFLTQQHVGAGRKKANPDWFKVLQKKVVSRDFADQEGKR